MKMGAKGPEPDFARRLSGHPQTVKVTKPAPIDAKSWIWAGNATNTAFAGPWGVSYAPNLTSDATGIGSWTEANFLAALKEGKHLGVGRPIAPPMPWPAYRHATDDDLKAVFAYLKTVPPVKNQAPEYEPPRWRGSRSLLLPHLTSPHLTSPRAPDDGPARDDAPGRFVGSRRPLRPCTPSRGARRRAVRGARGLRPPLSRS